MKCVSCKNIMGNADTKLHFRKAVIQLTTALETWPGTDDQFWDQFWSDSVTTIQDVFTLLPSTEIRALREESPSNLATLCYKAVEKMVSAADSSCRTAKEMTQVLNSARQGYIVLVILSPFKDFIFSGCLLDLSRIFLKIRIGVHSFGRLFLQLTRQTWKIRYV